MISLNPSLIRDNPGMKNLGSVGGPLLTKSSAVIVGEEAMENFVDTKNSIKALEDNIQQIPRYILVLNDRATTTYDIINGSQGLQAEVAWIVAMENDPIFTLLCPNTSVVRKMHWTHTDFSDWRHFVGFCTENKKHLRIGYNALMPFVSPNINTTSIEGIFLKTFIQKYQLSHEWNDANMSWGPFDKETRRFGGVVGMVGLFSL